MINDISQLKKYINISTLTNIDDIKPYFNLAINSKIKPHLGNTFFDDIVETNKYANLKENLLATVANYGIALAMPTMKINLSASGANYITDEHATTATWYDIRDYAYTAISAANKNLAKIIDYQNENNIESPNNFITKNMFKSFAYVKNYFSFDDDYNVLKFFYKLSDYVLDFYVHDRLGTGDVPQEFFVKHDGIYSVLKDTIAYYTLSELMNEPSLTFVNGTLIMEWDELPWQRKNIASEKEKEKFASIYINRANMFFEKLKNMIVKNMAIQEFIAKKNDVIRVVHTRKSGIYF